MRRPGAPARPSRRGSAGPSSRPGPAGPSMTAHSCARTSGCPGDPVSGATRTSTSPPWACSSCRCRCWAVNPPPGWLSSDVTSSQSPSGGGASPARDRTSMSSRSRGRASGMPGIPSPEPAGPPSGPGEPALTITHLQGLRMWPPPANSARRGRSPLHSAGDVKSGRARTPARVAPARHADAAGRAAGPTRPGPPAAAPGYYPAPGRAARAHIGPHAGPHGRPAEGAPGRAGVPATGRSVART